MARKNTKITFGTREWAEHNVNLMCGCGNDCLYCYAKSMAIQRFKRSTPETWKDEVVNPRMLRNKFRKRSGRVMFPSSHDITAQNSLYTLDHLEKLLAAGNEVLVVTKPHLEVIKQICRTFQQYRDQILFRFTIGSSDSAMLKFWEPGAPSFEERFRALQHAHLKEFETSISIEPMLDRVDAIIDLVQLLMPYVTDAVWIGKPNNLLSRVKMNGAANPEVIDRVNQLTAWYSDSEIRRLYAALKDNPKIEWKESIKKVVGLEGAVQRGGLR